MYKLTVQPKPTNSTSFAVELPMLQLSNGSLTASAGLRPKATISFQQQGASPMQRALAQVIIATHLP